MLSNIISIGGLVKVRRMAKRKGVWFRVLGSVERGIVDLTISYVKGIRSAKLAKIVTAIIIKLMEALESHVEKMVRTIGRSTAEKLSQMAQRWGNRLAHRWGEDEGFARYLAVMHINDRA